MPLTDPGPIVAARVAIRRQTEADLPALLEVHADDEVTALLPYGTWTSMADAEAWSQRMAGLQAAGDALQFVVVDQAVDRAIGTCLLFRHDEGSARVELGYVLGRSHWGRGLMREALDALLDCAFGRMDLRRIEAQVDTRNAASAALLARLGFTKEGLLRQRWVSKGEVRDVEMFGLLSHEWRSTAAIG